jgi:cytochrome c oxidase subunit 3
MNPPVTTIETKPTNLPVRSSASKGNGGNPFGGGGGDGPGVPGPVQRSGMYRIGMLSVLVAVSMTFAVLSSAYVYLAAQPHSWKAITPPRLVWVSTALIVFSSFSFHHVVRLLRSDMLSDGRRWLSVTLILGIGFLISQVVVWVELSRRGLFEAGNQQRSFFLILSITHGVHVVGGLIGLTYLRIRAGRGPHGGNVPLLSAARVIGLYWHFMTGVWLFVLTLLLVWH